MDPPAPRSLLALRCSRRGCLLSVLLLAPSAAGAERLPRAGATGPEDSWPLTAIASRTLPWLRRSSSRLRDPSTRRWRRDDTVCGFGEDVGEYGGSYKVPRRFYEKSASAVLDTPIPRTLPAMASAAPYAACGRSWKA